MNNRLLFHMFCLVVFDLGLGMMNFALNKPANQSTTLYFNNFNWTADKAVDGNNNGSDPDVSRTCSATIVTSSIAIHAWEVDIGVQIIVKNITVYGRNDKAWNQLYGVKLYLGNKPGPWNYSKEFTSDPLSDVPNVTYVFKPNSVIARYISLMRSNIILTICEVTVQGDCIQGTYGNGCNETCGKCYNGNSSCSLIDGRCINGCEAGWRGEICKLSTLGTDSLGDDNPNSGVIVGSVLPVVVVCIIAMVVIIVIVKKRRKGDNNETRTEMLTGELHYQNLAFDNTADASKISVQYKAKNETTFSATEKASMQRGKTNYNAKSFATENSYQVYDDYEKLRNGSGRPESAYSTIDANLIIDRKKESIENSIKYVEAWELLESALKSVEEEICSLLIKKENLLSCELEKARANRVADKRNENDSTLSDKEKYHTADDYTQTLRSIEDELKILEEKRKCILERKSILVRQEQVKKTETKL